jgi:hypothetical protein
MTTARERRMQRAGERAAQQLQAVSSSALQAASALKRGANQLEAARQARYAAALNGPAAHSTVLARVLIAPEQFGADCPWHLLALHEIARLSGAQDQEQYLHQGVRGPNRHTPEPRPTARGGGSLSPRADGKSR